MTNIRAHGIPKEFDRPLDEAEKSLLLWLAIRTIASQFDSDDATAAAALDQFADEGRSLMRWDDENAWLSVAEKSIVHARRDWLYFHSHRMPGAN
jgi:hypothetical protein